MESHLPEVAPGEPPIVTIQSDLYVAEPQTVTLTDGETRLAEIVVKLADQSDKP